MLILSQRLAVSALLAINESLVDRLPEPEAKRLREVIAAVKRAFQPRMPVLILADPDFEEDFFEPEAGVSA